MIETFLPLIEAARGVDLADPAAAERELARRLDPAGPVAQRLADELRKLLAAGAIANRGEMPVKWGRVAKATEQSSGFSIDVVHMNGVGPMHRHPNGEIDYCIPLSGEPRFDGRPAGWVVYGADSRHAPTVSGGEMLIVYLLPGGAMEFLT